MSLSYFNSEYYTSLVSWSVKTCKNRHFCWLSTVCVCLYQAESLSKVGVYVFLRENLLARQTLEHTLGLGHTGATDLDVAMFHRNGGTLTHDNLHACTYSHLHTLLNCSLVILDLSNSSVCDHVMSELVSFSLSILLVVCQVRTQTQILISHWKRSGVCPSHHQRARTMCACVDASSGASNGLVTANVYSQSPPTTVEKVPKLLLQFIIEARGVQEVSFILRFVITVSVWNCSCVRSGWQWPALLLASAGRLWGTLTAEMGLRAPSRGRLQQGCS